MSAPQPRAPDLSWLCVGTRPAKVAHLPSELLDLIARRSMLRDLRNLSEVSNEWRRLTEDILRARVKLLSPSFRLTVSQIGDKTTVLDLSGSKTGIRLGDIDMGILADAIINESLGNLKRLWLNSNNIGDCGMDELSRAIASGSLGNLETLGLHQNQIGVAGMRAFAGAIASGSLGKLNTLSLQSNNIGDAGMSALAAAITSGSLPSLKFLLVDGEKHPQLKAACEARTIEIL